MSEQVIQLGLWQLRDSPGVGEAVVQLEGDAWVYRVGGR